MSKTLIVLDGHMMDYVVEVDDRVLQSLGFDPKNGFVQMTASEWEALWKVVLAQCLTPIERVGGAGANTARHYARLEGEVHVYGQVGDDIQGSRFIDQLRTDGCQSAIRVVKGATGRTLVFVRPDGERLMCSDVGIVMEFDDHNAIDFHLISRPWFHLTGYLLDPRFEIHRAAWASMEVAMGQEVPISMDVGSAAYLGIETVRRVAANYLSVMFLNREEACSLGFHSEEEAAKHLIDYVASRRDAIVVITRGVDDVLIRRGIQVIYVPTQKVVVRDTTGAGDSFAAGFLFAYGRAQPLSACAELGCQLAARTVQHLGGVSDLT